MVSHTQKRLLGQVKWMYEVSVKVFRTSGHTGKWILGQVKLSCEVSDRFSEHYHTPKMLLGQVKWRCEVSVRVFRALGHIWKLLLGQVKWMRSVLGISKVTGRSSVQGHITGKIPKVVKSSRTLRT